MSCEGCLYWKNLDSRACSADKCCHYLLTNYKRRPVAEDGRCLGYTPKGEHQEQTINKQMKGEQKC